MSDILNENEAAVEPVPDNWLVKFQTPDGAMEYPMVANAYPHMEGNKKVMKLRFPADSVTPDDAYKLKENTGDLEVYNNGVFLESYWGYTRGEEEFKVLHDVGAGEYAVYMLCNDKTRADLDKTDARVDQLVAVAEYLSAMSGVDIEPEMLP